MVAIDIYNKHYYIYTGIINEIEEESKETSTGVGISTVEVDC